MPGVSRIGTQARVDVAAVVEVLRQPPVVNALLRIASLDVSTQDLLGIQVIVEDEEIMEASREALEEADEAVACALAFQKIKNVHRFLDSDSVMTPLDRDALRVECQEAMRILRRGVK